jgi:predicted O-linked N-acetylglucosamine transferase (SPINDLY family)
MTTTVAAAAESAFRQAVVLHQKMKLDAARTFYERTLQIEPSHVSALHLLGVLALQDGQPQQAAELIGKALVLEPFNAAALVNYGTARHELGHFDAAIASYDKALAFNPSIAEAYHNRGNALRDLKQPAAAVASYDRAIALKPGYADAFLNRGLALCDLDQPQAAIESYDSVIAVHPDNADAHYNRGNVLRDLAHYEQAVASYDRAIMIQPGFADAHLNRGSALVALRRHHTALESYAKAVALRPRHAQAHFNRAGALQHLGRYEAAVGSYDAAIALRPDYADAHANRGRALRELKDYQAAISAYDAALRIEPGSAALIAVRRHIKMQICDWNDLDSDAEKIKVGVESGAAAPNPFYVLTLCDEPDLQRVAAESWVRQECPRNDSLRVAPPSLRNDRIHIGYFSADYHEHATAYLIAQLFELHDRSRFRVSAFSFGPSSDTPLRKRLAAACEFIDVRDRSDADVARLARDMGVDIAVDLKGYTQDNRAGVFARRAAPIQVNYLGYPGTMGAHYIDYLIADPIVVTPDSRPHYTENIIYLPHSYQVNDTRRRIADRAFDRGELNLPPTGFVFCCFNNVYKLQPPLFDSWMRILSRVESSVLWLLGDNPIAIRSLRRQAQARNIAPERLVFAERTDLANHLARHRAADLFLDTIPCNAHTTASDALWAGVPVLTCAGRSFAARVAASLVAAIGLPDLIVTTPQHYEDLAVELARDPLTLQRYRHHLRDRRLTEPLFDTPRYCRNIEAALAAAHERHLAGLPPADLQLPEQLI